MSDEASKWWPAQMSAKLSCQFHWFLTSSKVMFCVKVFYMTSSSLSVLSSVSRDLLFHHPICDLTWPFIAKSNIIKSDVLFLLGQYYLGHFNNLVNKHTQCFSIYHIPYCFLIFHILKCFLHILPVLPHPRNIWTFLPPTPTKEWTFGSMFCRYQIDLCSMFNNNNVVNVYIYWGRQAVQMIYALC